MSNVIALTRVELKNYWRRLIENMGAGKRKGLIIVALIWLVFTFIFLSVQLSNTLYLSLGQMGLSELTFTIMYLIISMVIMFLSFSALINLFYYSKNTGFLLTLPIKENVIILARIAVQYVFSFLMSTVFLLPALIIYFSRSGLTIVGLLGGVIVLLLAPLAPLLIASILVVLVMSTVGRSINRRVMSVIVNFLVIAIIIGLQVLIARQSASGDFITKLLLSEDGLLYYFGLRFPPVVWATRMITGSFLNLVLFVGLNLVILISVNLLARPLVRNTLRSFNQAESKVIHRRASYQGRSVIGALVRRNLQIVYKTPAFLMNALLLIILPLFIVGINLLSGTQSIESWRLIIDSLNRPEMQPWLPLIVAAVLISPAFIGTFSATAITREGKHLWQIKTAPVSAQVDLKARLISCAVIIGIGIIYLPFVLIWMLPVTVMDLLWGILIVLPTVYAMLTIDICIDINRPILNWTSPTHAVKNNLNIMIGLAWRLLLGFLIFIVIRVISPVVTTLTLKYVLLLLMVLIAVAGHLLFRKSIVKYQQLEIK